MNITIKIKTYNFLDKNKNAGVIYFESESAISKDMIEGRGVDGSRTVVIPVSTVQEFRAQSIKIIDKYIFKQLLPPFFLSLFILVFVLLTQFLIKHLDRFLGKDLSFLIILKFLSCFA